MSDDSFLWARGGKCGCALHIAAHVQCDISWKVAVHQVIHGNCMSCFLVGKTTTLDRRQFALLPQSILFYILCFYDILIGNGITIIEMGNDNSLINDVLDTHWRVIDQALRDSSYREIRIMFYFTQVVFNNLWTIFISWRGHMDFTVETTRTQKCSIESIGKIGSTDGQNWFCLGVSMIEADQAEQLFEPACIDRWRVQLHQ